MGRRNGACDHLQMVARGFEIGLGDAQLGEASVRGGVAFVSFQDLAQVGFFGQVVIKFSAALGEYFEQANRWRLRKGFEGGVIANQSVGILGAKNAAFAPPASPG